MTKTENYQLPQWEPHDPVRRTDFNAANQSIDAAIKAASDAAKQAQQTADAAQRSTDTALAGAYLIGSYTGNGVKKADGGQSIELGFRPRFLIISRGWSVTSLPSSTTMVGEHQISAMSDILTLTETGFCVGQPASTASNDLKLNDSTLTYSFVAFR